MNLRHLLPLTAACAAFAALVPASASAVSVTFTQSAIDAPGDKSHLGSAQPIQVTGTAGGGPLLATGQLICTRRAADGTTAWSTIAPTVAVENGRFSTAIDAETLPSRLPCRLRLIPAGSSPADLSPFTGPRVIGLASHDYAAWDMTSHFSLHDAASCGVGSVGLSDVDGDDPLSGPETMGCAAHFREWADDPALVPAGRSQVRIDGADAFLQNAAPITRERDASSGDVRWSETHDVVRCAHAVFPLDDEHLDECGGLVPTGVRFERSGVVEQDGTVIGLRDRWSSTDGAAHDLDLLHEFDLVTGPDSGVWFPWAGYFFEQYPADAPVPGPSLAGPGSFFTRPDRSRLGVLDPTTAISYSDAPDQIRWGRFEIVTQAAAELAYDRHVAAGEPYRQAFVLSTSPSLPVAQVMAVDGEERLSPPQLWIATPTDGGTVPAGSVEVTGDARDNHGIASLTVNGEPAAREGDLWRATLTLSVGSATVVVRAVDNDGNVAVARRSFTVVPTIPAPAADDPVPTPTPAPTPAGPSWTPAPPAPRCIVPSLRGLTLAKARARLRAAHCIVGRVPGKAKRRPRVAVVVRQSPKAGTSAPEGAYVALDVRRPRSR